MPRWGLNLLLFLAGVEVVWRFWRRTGRELRRFPDYAETLAALRGMLILLVTVMLMNSFALVSATLLDPWTRGGDQPPALGDILPGQLGLLFGTWGIFSLLAASITTGVFSHPPSSIATTLQGTLSALEALLKRMALPLLGLGTLFGVAGEGSILVILAAEILFVWAFLRVQLAIRTRRTE